MSPKTTPLRVAVLAGGDSEEREISLKSGQAVADALTETGHQVLQLDPAIVDVAGIDWSQFDVAFVALHGSFGEDGQVQHILDEAGVRYTGSGAVASRLAFSKSAAKEQFELFGVPTPAFTTIHYNDDLNEIRKKAEEIGYPLVVKPDTQGSSLGVSIVRNPAQLTGALRTCFQFDSVGIIEAMIEGTEWTVGLIDLQVLPAIKIETDRPFYDWQAKYEDNQTRYVFDSGVPADVVESLERVAWNACSAIGTSGLARVDLRLDAQNQAWVLEINTIPGFTDHSLLPKAAARVGIDFPVLCDRIVRSCLRKSITAHRHEVQLRPHVLLTPRERAHH
ncbi:D-alanine--D-alanine ligase [Schlesneria sp. T3-172]|uniref:D-alanine--D-alanine ligase family protein n=1 Tax=Schlesneria sphaerica TaxID=3373610 RepID=UPI0037C65895